MNPYHMNAINLIKTITSEKYFCDDDKYSWSTVKTVVELVCGCAAWYVLMPFQMSFIDVI